MSNDKQVSVGGLGWAPTYGHPGTSTSACEVRGTRRPGGDRLAPAASGSPPTPSSPGPRTVLPRAASPWPLRPSAWRWLGHLVPDGAGLLGHLVMSGWGLCYPLLLGLVKWLLRYPPGNIDSRKARCCLIRLWLHFSMWPRGVRLGSGLESRSGTGSQRQSAPHFRPPLVSGTLPEDGAGGGLGIRYLSDIYLSDSNLSDCIQV